VETLSRSKLEAHLISAVPYQGARRLARPILRFFLSSRWLALCIHWTFQGVVNMDRTERLFKLGTDLIIALPLWFGFRIVMAEYMAVPLAVLAAHTVNFIFNGHTPIVLLHYGVRKYDRSALFQYVECLRQRLSKESSILAAGIWGGIARGEKEGYPDLDLRVFRKQGIRNGVSACWFMVRERTHALFSGFPLDAFLSDGWRHISRLRADEMPVLLYDPSGFMRKRYESAPDWRMLYPDAGEGNV